MPYMRPDSASSICLVRKRYRGSGFTLNGFSFKPKKLLYMIVWRLRDALVGLPGSTRYRRTKGRVCQFRPIVIWWVVKLDPQLGPAQMVLSAVSTYAV